MYSTVFLILLACLNVTDTVIPLLCDITCLNDDLIRILDRLIVAIMFSAASNILISQYEIQIAMLALWRILFIINFYRFSLINFFSAFIRFINEREHKSCYRNVVIKTIVDTQSDSISLPVYLATKIFEKRYKVLNSSMISTIEKSSAMLGVQCHYIWPHCWRAINVHVTGSLHRICNRIRADRNLITLR